MFTAFLDFPDSFDTSLYTWKAEIANQLGSAVSIASFTIAAVDGATDQLQISLTSEQTQTLPEKSYWDIQGTLISDTTQKRTYIRGMVITTRQVTE